MRLAVPAVLTNIAIPLLGLSDTAISGHLGKASYIGAISVGAMMLNVVYWGFGFLRAGTTGLTATRYGAGDRSAAGDVLRKSLLLAAALAIAVLILRHPLLQLMLLITGPEPDVAAYASRYFLLCVWAAPAQLGTMALTGWFIGMQTTVAPMIVSLTTNLLNIALSLLLVFVAGMGFEGVAAGTVAASWAGLLLAAIAGRVIWKRSAKTLPQRGESQPVKLGKFFSVNRDLFLRSLFMIAVSLAVTAIGSRLGTVTLAANAVMMNFFIFFSYFMDGFAFAGEALVGKFSGASDSAGLTRCVRALLIWSVAMATTFFLIYLFWSDAIAALITDNEEVCRAVAGMRLWIILLPPITVAAFIFDGIFIGLTSIRPMLLSTLCGALLFAGTEAAGTEWHFLPPEDTLWLAFELYLLARGSILGLKYVIIHRQISPQEGKIKKN